MQSTLYAMSMKFRLRDFKRAIEDYQTKAADLLRCDVNSWDGKVAGFKQFLKSTPMVGEQMQMLAQKTQGDIEPCILEGSFPIVIYKPPADEDLKLSLLTRIVLEKDANFLVMIGMQLAQRSGGRDAFFHHARGEILVELFTVLETRLVRKLEDLSEDFKESDQITFSQIVIVDSNVGIAQPGGTVTFNLNSTSELGISIIERHLESLRRELSEIRNEQERSAVATEAHELNASKKIDEILKLVRANQPGPALELWKGFTQEISVSRAAEAAGNIMDVVSLVLLVLNISQGRPPS